MKQISLFITVLLIWGLTGLGAAVVGSKFQPVTKGDLAAFMALGPIMVPVVAFVALVKSDTCVLGCKDASN